MDKNIHPAGQHREFLAAQPEIFFRYFARDALDFLTAELTEGGGAFILEPVKNSGHCDLMIEALPCRNIPIVSPDQQDNLLTSDISRMIFSMTTFPKNPVEPVIRIRLPANCFFTDISLLVNMNALLLGCMNIEKSQTSKYH